MRRKAKKAKSRLARIALLIAFSVVIYFTWTNAGLAERPDTPGTARAANTPPLIQETQTQDIERSAIESAGAEDPQAAPGFTIPIHIDDIVDMRYLELINRDHAINGEPEGRMLVSAWPAVPVSNTEVSLHEGALEALSDLFIAARSADAGGIFVSSGYRNYEKQRQVYEEAADKSYAQPPNHSEHQSGLAVDIMVADVPQSEIVESREGKWLAGNSWEYGFILRYAGDKREITGVPAEPWHFRYVGQPHASYCSQNNLCFEEYIEDLKENGGYSMDLGSTSYTVLYQVPQDGILYLPRHMEYWVSGDNTGGYVITAWE